MRCSAHEAIRFSTEMEAERGNAKQDRPVGRWINIVENIYKL